MSSWAVSTLALPRDALQWEAVARAGELVQGCSSSPGHARLLHAHGMAAELQGFGRPRAAQ